MKKRIEAIFAVMCTTKLVPEIKPEKNSGPYGILTHDLCDTNAAPTELKSQLRAGDHVGSMII